MVASPDGCKLTEAVQYRHLASCQLYFGEPGKALETLRVGLRRLPDTPQRIMNEAALHDCMADVYAKMGDKAMSTAEYHKALELFAKRPKGPSKNAAVTQAKLEMLAETLDVARIPDGSYTSSALGYVGDVKYRHHIAEIIATGGPSRLRRAAGARCCGGPASSLRAGLWRASARR